MPLNSSKLDAIRAKLIAQSPPTVPTVSTVPTKETNASPPAIQAPAHVQAGKASVIVSLGKLEATAVASTRTLPTQSQAETAGTINFQRVADSISSLEEAIHTAHPRMPQLLHDIWSTLHSYPEQVTLLSEQQCAIVFSGLEKIVDADLAALTIKGALKGGKKAPVSNASLGF